MLTRIPYLSKYLSKVVNNDMFNSFINFICYGLRGYELGCSFIMKSLDGDLVASCGEIIVWDGRSLGEEGGQLGGHSLNVIWGSRLHWRNGCCVGDISSIVWRGDHGHERLRFPCVGDWSKSSYHRQWLQWGWSFRELEVSRLMMRC